MRGLTTSIEEVAHGSRTRNNHYKKRYLGLGSTKENRTMVTCDSAKQQD